MTIRAGHLMMVDLPGPTLDLRNRRERVPHLAFLIPLGVGTILPGKIDRGIRSQRVAPPGVATLAAPWLLDKARATKVRLQLP